MQSLKQRNMTSNNQSSENEDINSSTNDVKNMKSSSQVQVLEDQSATAGSFQFGKVNHPHELIRSVGHNQDARNNF